MTTNHSSINQVKFSVISWMRHSFGLHIKSTFLNSKQVGDLLFMTLDIISKNLRQLVMIKTFPTTSGALELRHRIINQTPTYVINRRVGFFRWHPPKNDPDSFIGFTDWTGFLHGLAQRNDVGRLVVCGILEMLEHLALVGVLDFEPFTLCVISGGGIKVYLENS